MAERARHDRHAEEERRARPLHRSFVVHGFILAMLVIYAAPIIGVMLTSVQTNAEIAARGVWHIPENASLENFVDVWSNTPTPRYLLNSFLVTIPATFLSILGGVLLGYVFSQFRFPFAELLFLVVIAGMFFPPQAMLIPLFRMFNSPIEIFGFQILPALYDTVYPMIIIHMSLGLAITTLLMRNFMSALPSGLREAAIVDGAGEWSVLFRVVAAADAAGAGGAGDAAVHLDLERLPVAAGADALGRGQDHHGRHQRAQGPVQRGLGQPGRHGRHRQHPHHRHLHRLPALLHRGLTMGSVKE